MEQYNPDTNTWTPKASMLHTRESLGSVALTGELYAIGGYDPGVGYTASVEQYNSTTDSWSSITSMPQSNIGPAVTLANKIYVVHNGDGLTYEYDPGSDTWSSLSGLSTPRQEVFATVASSNRLYLMGGLIGDVATSMMEEGIVSGLPFKPPLVLVHGFLGFNGTYTDTCSIGTTPFHYSTALTSTIEAERGNIEYFDQVSEHFAENYDVWIAHVAGGPQDPANKTRVVTPALAQNAACLASQLEHIYQVNHQPITLVAHSMGGAVSRACLTITNQSPNCRMVNRLFTLGSPHAGLPGKYWVWLNSESRDKAHPGLVDLMPDRMVGFNRRNPNRVLPTYVFIGGDIPGWDVLAGGDGVVGKYSALGWLNGAGSTNPAGWDIGYCNPNFQSCNTPWRYWTDESHTKLPLIPNSPYFADRDSQPSVSYRCITWFTGGRQGNPPGSCRQAATSGAGIAYETQANGTPSQSTPFLTGSLSAGAQISHPVQIDASGLSGISLNWIEGSLGLTLTQPGGQVIDFAYADANPGVVTYTVIPGGLGVFNQITYFFTSTVPGAWQLHINNASTATVEYLAFAQFETTRTLSIAVSAEDLTIGDVAVFTATLTNGANGIAGATVTAQLSRADGVTETLPLIDRGGGVYTTTWTVANVPGYLPISVMASGTDTDAAFEREEVIILAIAPQTAQLTGAYSDSGGDDNGNGLYDSLNVLVGVTSSVSGTFTLSGDLFAGNQVVAHAMAYTSVITGAQSITLRFVGEDIYLSGLNGPYTLTNVTLSDLTYGSIPASTALSPHITDAYHYTDFDGTRLLYLPLIRR